MLRGVDERLDRLRAERAHREARRTDEQMALAVGFRNVLVHRYVDVDDSRVVGFLDELDTLGRFVSQLSAWIAETDSRPPTA